MLLVAVVVLGLSSRDDTYVSYGKLQENALDNLRSRTTELRPIVATLAASSDAKWAALARLA